MSIEGVPRTGRVAALKEERPNWKGLTMRKMRWLCLALVVCVVLSSVAWAAEDKATGERTKKVKRGAEKGEKAPKEHKGRRGGSRSRMTPEQILAKYTKDLELTKDQQPKVMAIFAAYTKDVAGVYKGFKGMREAMAKARKDKDEKALKELGEKRKKAMEQYRTARDKRDKALLEILTDAQKEKFKKMQAERRSRYSKAREGKDAKKGEGKRREKGKGKHPKKGAAKDKPAEK